MNPITPTIIKYNPLVGTHIDSAIATAIEMATENGHDVEIEFNGSLLHIRADAPDVNYRAIFDADQERRAEVYRASPEGQKAAQEAKEHLEASIAANRVLLKDLPAILGSKDNVRIMAWLCKLESASHVDVPVDYQNMARRFIAAGYEASVNLGPKFNAKDSDNFARYIIGQCVSCMTIGMPPHQILHSFVKQWEEVHGMNK